MQHLVKAQSVTCGLVLVAIVVSVSIVNAFVVVQFQVLLWQYTDISLRKRSTNLSLYTDPFFLEHLINIHFRNPSLLETDEKQLHYTFSSQLINGSSSFVQFINMHWFSALIT